jgi:hypothetical protein
MEIPDLHSSLNCFSNIWVRKYKLRRLYPVAESQGYLLRAHLLALHKENSKL